MEHLTQYMATKALTHREMAEAIGVSRCYLTQIINSTRFPSRKVMHRIAEATDGAVPAATWFEAPPAQPVTLLPTSRAAAVAGGVEADMEEEIEP